MKKNADIHVLLLNRTHDVMLNIIRGIHMV